MLDVPSMEGLGRSVSTVQTIGNGHKDTQCVPILFVGQLHGVFLFKTQRIENVAKHGRFGDRFWNAFCVWPARCHERGDKCLCVFPSTHDFPWLDLSKSRPGLPKGLRDDDICIECQPRGAWAEL